MSSTAGSGSGTASAMPRAGGGESGRGIASSGCSLRRSALRLSQQQLECHTTITSTHRELSRCATSKDFSRQISFKFPSSPLEGSRFSFKFPFPTRSHWTTVINGHKHPPPPAAHGQGSGGMSTSGLTPPAACMPQRTHETPPSRLPPARRAGRGRRTWPCGSDLASCAPATSR